jgi:hypothetical protein
MTRGGKRDGAGRKPVEQRKEVLTGRVSPDTIAFVQEEKALKGCSAGDIIERAIDIYRDTPKKQLLKEE